MMKKGWLAILFLFSLIFLTACENSPTCVEEEKWIEWAQKGCDQDLNCICSDKNILGQCVKCNCKTTETKCY